MTQKGDAYIKVFSTLSDVRLPSFILSQLNILCTSLVKPRYSRMTIHPLFTVHTLRPFYVFSDLLVSSTRSVPYIMSLLCVWLRYRTLSTWSVVAGSVQRYSTSATDRHQRFNVMRDSHGTSPTVSKYLRRVTDDKCMWWVHCQHTQLRCQLSTSVS